MAKTSYQDLEKFIKELEKAGIEKDYIAKQIIKRSLSISNRKRVYLLRKLYDVKS